MNMTPGMFPRPIVTQVVPLKAAYPAEPYHRDYAAKHPNNLHILYNDAPKVAHLKKAVPDIYTGKQWGNYSRTLSSSFFLPQSAAACT